MSLYVFSRLVDHINRTDGDNGRSETILNSAMSEMFVGQIFCFEFNSNQVYPLNSSGQEVSTKPSLTVKQMFSMYKNTNSATVLYCIFSELQCIQLQSFKEDFLNKIKCETQILKKRANEIKKKLQHENAQLFENEEYEGSYQNEDKDDSACYSSAPKANNRSEHVTSGLLMNESYMKDFFQDSFSLSYREEAVCEDQSESKHPILIIDDLVSATRQLPRRNCSISEIWSTNDSIFLQIPTTPEMSNIPLNDSVNVAASEDVKDPFNDSINMDVTWSHILKRQKHSYLTSTPAHSEPRIKRRRISDARQPSSLGSRRDDNSADDMFASESLTNQDNVQSMDLFESMN